MGGQLDTVLGKTVAILHSFTAEDRVLPLSELVRRTGLPKATVHRIAGELVHLRLMDKTPNGYRLSGGLFELGLRASSERTLLEVAMPFLQDLYERTHETVHLGVREGTEVVYIAKIGGHRQVAAPSRTGGRMPMHCTAIGKALLATAEPILIQQVLSAPLERRTPHTIIAPGVLHKQLRKVVESGVAYEHEESALGLQCIACAVFDAEGVRPVAAISVSGPTGRFRPEGHHSVVRATATALSSTLARQRR